MVWAENSAKRFAIEKAANQFRENFHFGLSKYLPSRINSLGSLETTSKSSI